MLNLPLKFKNDIIGRDTALIPLVIIKNARIDSNGSVLDVYMSTNSIDFDGNFYAPLLLNIPTIRESIDIQSRKFKINSVSLEISNAEYQNSRFTDLTASSLQNYKVEIYWHSPSAQTLSDTLHTFSGIIRKYDFDTQRVKLSVEDKTEQLLYKDLPTKTLKSDDTILDKYKNAKIPMTYGRIEKAPCVIDFASGNKIIKWDYKPTMGPIGENETVGGNNPEYLFIGLDDNYIMITSTIRTGMDYYVEELGYENADDLIGTLQWSQTYSNYYWDIYLGDNQLLNAGIIQGKAKGKPSSFKLKAMNPIHYVAQSNHINLYNEDHEDFYIDITEGLIDFGQVIDEDYELVQQASAMFTVAPEATSPANTRMWSKQSLIINTHTNVKAKARKILVIKVNNVPLPSYGTDRVIAIFPYGENPDSSLLTNNWAAAGSPDRITLLTGGKIRSLNYYNLDDNIYNKEYSDNAEGTVEDVEGNTYIYSDLMASSVNETNYNNYNSAAPFHINHDCMEALSTILHDDLFVAFEDLASDYRIHFINCFHTTSAVETEKSNEVVFKIKEIDIESSIDIEDALTYNFYINAQGRRNSSGSLTENAVEIMQDILNEVGADIDTGYQGTDTIGDPYVVSGIHKFKYGFSVDEKINAKELLENIASVSPYIPHFDSMGNFKFDIIHSMGGGSQQLVNGIYEWVPPNIASDFSPNHIINEKDVIDFSFSRTPVSEVYTNIEINYNYDYLRKEYTKKRTLDMDYFACFDWQTGQGTEYGNYNYNYYGFIDDNGEIEKQELKIDDARGKYIRDDATAERYLCWLMSWFGQQHLIIKLKLPLKYLNLETSDLCQINKIIADIYPYGIDYTKINDNIWGQKYQAIFPTFQITKTTKTLEYVEIEKVQLHQLWSSSASVVDADGNIELLNPGSTPGCTEVILGCTIPTACNYDPDATISNSCIMPYDMYLDEDADGIGTSMDSVSVCNESDLIDGNLPEGVILRSDALAQNYVDSCCDDCDADPAAMQVEGNTIDPDTGLDCAGICNGDTQYDACGVCGGDTYQDGDYFISEGITYCGCIENVGPNLPLDECDVCGGQGEDSNGCCSYDSTVPSYELVDCLNNCYSAFEGGQPEWALDNCGQCLLVPGHPQHDPDLWNQLCEYSFSVAQNSLHIAYPPMVGQDITFFGDLLEGSYSFNGPGQPTIDISGASEQATFTFRILTASGDGEYGPSTMAPWMWGVQLTYKIIVKRYLFMYDVNGTLTHTGECETIFDDSIVMVLNSVDDLFPNWDEVNMSTHNADFNIFKQMPSDPVQLTNQDRFEMQIDIWFSTESVDPPDAYDDQFPGADEGALVYSPGDDEVLHTTTYINHMPYSGEGSPEMVCSGIEGDVNNDGLGFTEEDWEVALNVYQNLTWLETDEAGNSISNCIICFNAISYRGYRQSQEDYDPQEDGMRCMYDFWDNEDLGGVLGVESPYPSFMCRISHLTDPEGCVTWYDLMIFYELWGGD